MAQRYGNIFKFSSQRIHSNSDKERWHETENYSYSRTDRSPAHAKRAAMAKSEEGRKYLSKTDSGRKFVADHDAHMKDLGLPAVTRK